MDYYIINMLYLVAQLVVQQIIIYVQLVIMYQQVQNFQH